MQDPPFPPDRYGPLVAELFAEPRLPALGPGVPVAGLRGLLERMSSSDWGIPVSQRDAKMADCCRSALWLWCDFLHESHTISQSIETREGSYWHGMMHRREPDYGNAKYWFRHVGDHPTWPELQRQAAAWCQGRDLPAAARPLVDAAAWDPFEFIDLCQQAAEGEVDLESLCRELARIEWQLLFDYCWQQGFG